MADCNTPVQLPCGPGPFLSPVCYTVPPSGVTLNGFKRITLNPDCSAASIEILDDAFVLVPGAVEAGCTPLAPPDCCDSASICTILQGLPTQVPGVADTALFVTLGGCFLGVPGGGGGGFPGYGIPVTTACANAGGVSLLVARADHVHRSEVPVQDEGIAVGSRCSINFIGAGVTAVDNPGLDRVDITIPGTTFPLLAPDGTCLAPSYAFTSSPDSGVFYTGTAVRISDDNCADFIDIGASINIFSTASNILVQATLGTVTLNAPASSITETAGTTWTATATGAASLTGASVAISSSATTLTLTGATAVEILTSATSRLLINSLGAWNVSAGGFGAAGEVVTSNGAGVPPTWQATGAAFPGFGVPPVLTVDAAAPSAGVAATAMRSDAKLQAATGAPVATAQANAAGVLDTLARADHVHRTILQVQDTGVLVSSRPTINFIDGVGITVTIVDNAGSDRADITVATTSGVTGFATPTVAADAAAATGGVATTAIRSDAKLSVSTAAPITVSGATNSIGVAATLARSDHVHRLGVEVQEEGVLTATRPRLNFVGAGVTVTDDAGGDRAVITIPGGGSSFIQRFTFQADQFDSPVNANWAVNSLAPAAADSLNNAITVRRFDDTTEEGVGGLFTVPTGAVSITLYFKSRAQTAPGAAVAVQPTLYNRLIGDNVVVDAWSAALNLTVISIPTNTNFQYDTQTITLAALGWAVGQLRQFELTRRGTEAGDTLTGDWDLAEMLWEFTT